MPDELSKSDYQRLVSDISAIYERAKAQSIVIVKKISLAAYGDMGKSIVEVEQKHNLRADYGVRLLENLSRELTVKFGKGFSVTNLKYMRQFYQTYRIGHARDELEWTHYRLLVSIKEKDKRDFYENQIIKHHWNSRKLEEVLRRDKIQLEDFRLKRLIPRNETQTPAKLSLTRGRLYTYKIIEPDYINKTEGSVVVDCGFYVNVEVPLKGISKPEQGDIVESTKTSQDFSFKPLDAKKNQLYTYKALVEKVTDADTLWVNIDCGFNIWIRQKLRFRGIDAPELSSKKGQKAKRFVEAVLRDVLFVIIKTHSPDKYGRYLVDVFYQRGEDNPPTVLEQGIFLNQQLLDLGLARLLE